MSVLKSIGKIIGGFLFCLILSLALMLFSVGHVTEYENVKSITSGMAEAMAEKMVPESQIDEKMAEYNIKASDIPALLKAYCAKQNKIVLPPEMNLNLEIDCKKIDIAKIEKLTNPKDIVKATVQGAVEDIYYKDYGCDFVGCISTGKGMPMVLLSSASNKFFKDMALISLLVLIIPVLILFFSCSTWVERLFAFGSTLFVTGIGAFIIKLSGNLIALPKEYAALKAPVDSIINSFTDVFLYSFLLGALLLALGFSIKYRSWFEKLFRVKKVDEKKKEEKPAPAEKKAKEKKQ